MNIWETVKERISCTIIADEAGVDTSKSKTVCPFCKYEKNKSFYVTDDYFTCHHCQKKGDVFTLFSELNNTERWGACKALCSRLSIPFKQTEEEKKQESQSEIFKKFAAEFALKDMDSEVTKHLIYRGLTPEFIQEKMIGFIPPEFRNKRFFPDHIKKIFNDLHLPKNNLAGTILIPFWSFGQIIYFTGYIPKTEKHKSIYINLELRPKPLIGSMKGPELIVAEGVFDTLLAEQKGYNVIGIAGSSKEIKLHKGIKKCTLIFDGDEPGRKFIEKHALPLYGQGADVDIVLLDEGTDLADYLEAGKDIEDLEKTPIFDYYLEKLKRDKKDKEIKKTVYRVMQRMDEFDREECFKVLKGVFEFSLTVIRRDYKIYTDERLSSEFKTADGLSFAVPEGYMMGPFGIMEGKNKIASNPYYISRVGQDRSSGLQFVETRFALNGSFVSRIIPRSCISITTELLKESGYGAPVNSANAINMIKFFEEWNMKNQERFDNFKVVSTLGWNDNDQFVFPNRIVSLNEEKGVYYSGSIPDNAYVKKGNIQEWTKTIRLLGKLKDGHIARFFIYAGFASIILEKLNLKPFILHIHGDTSKGKTTLLRIVSSIYGNPKEGKTIIRWENTLNYVIRMLETLKNIPCFIDDSTGKSTKGDFSPIIYMVEAGLSKGKADKNDPLAVVKQRAFNLGVFSSGEAPLLSEKAPGGASLRAWEFYGNPFGCDNKELIRKIEAGIYNNHGVGIDPFIEEFLKNRDMFDQDHSFIDEKGLTNEEDRISKHLNVIFLTGLFINEKFQLEFDVYEDMKRVFDICRQPIKEKARTVDKIMELINGHYSENQVCFPHVEIDGVSGKQSIVRDNNRLPNKIFGYVVGNDLAFIKSHFINLFNDLLPATNGGQYAINRLLEAQKINKNRVVKKIEGSQTSLIIFENYFQDDSVDIQENRELF